MSRSDQTFGTNGYPSVQGLREKSMMEPVMTASRRLAALPGPDDGPYRRSVGLSVLLARAIATSHGGTLTMTQQPDGEVAITVRLPAP